MTTQVLQITVLIILIDIGKWEKSNNSVTGFQLFQFKVVSCKIHAYSDNIYC